MQLIVWRVHHLTGVQVRRGLWSSPLMSVGPKLYTLYDGPETLSGAEWVGKKGWPMQAARKCACRGCVAACAACSLVTTSNTTVAGACLFCSLPHLVCSAPLHAAVQRDLGGRPGRLQDPGALQCRHCGQGALHPAERGGTRPVSEVFLLMVMRTCGQCWVQRHGAVRSLYSFRLTSSLQTLPPFGTQSDVTACKSLITLIDSVLLPFDPTAAPAPDYLAVSSLVGARGCGVQPNALITGTELQAGDANRHVSFVGWQLGWSEQRLPGPGLRREEQAH